MSTVTDVQPAAKAPARKPAARKVAAAPAAPVPDQTPATPETPALAGPASADRPADVTQSGPDVRPPTAAPDDRWKYVPAALRPSGDGFTDAQHAMLDAKNTPADRRGRALLWREWLRTGLDPFATQIYLREDHTTVKTKNDIGNLVEVRVPVYSVGVRIDGMRVVAQHRTTYAGQTAPQWCGPDGHWRDNWTADVAPVAARIGVLVRGYPQPMWGVARYREFKASDSSQSLWVRMPSHMIAKVAEALALRKAYPDQLSGVMTDDEMAQAGWIDVRPDSVVIADSADDIAAAAFLEASEAMACYATAKLVADDQGAIRELYQDAANRRAGSLLGVHLVETGHTLGRSLIALNPPTPVRTNEPPQGPQQDAPPDTHDTPPEDHVLGDNERRENDQASAPAAPDPVHCGRCGQELTNEDRSRRYQLRNAPACADCYHQGIPVPDEYANVNF